ncbi:MAG: hypothetical protein O3A92_04110 [Verrucomicrobia bacterium]|nr:hypothetical protein [Verrucomicrobiota bacterium]
MARRGGVKVKIRLITTAIGGLLCAWLVGSFSARATTGEGPARLGADAHRLGPVMEEVAGLPAGEREVGQVNLFVLLTKGEDGVVASR